MKNNKKTAKACDSRSVTDDATVDENFNDDLLADDIPRTKQDILEAYYKYMDMVWWYRYQLLRKRIASGDEILTEELKKFLKRAKKEAKLIEERFGLEDLTWDDISWGLFTGRMSALAWVLGTDWLDSLAIPGTTEHFYRSR